MDNKTILYHDEFIKKVDSYIDELTNLKKNGKTKEYALKSLEFAKFKVAYDEQFLGTGVSYAQNKEFEDEYNTSLNKLADARDLCMDLGIYEE